MSNGNRKPRRLPTNNPEPHPAWIPGILSKATSTALALAIVLGLGAVATPSAGAQTFSVLYNFTGSGGAFPQAGLVRDATGNLYGTTEEGGASGYGVVFKVDTGGTEVVLHSFTGGKDGEYPVAELIRDRAGNLYGTTSGGGDHGLGTVFKLDTAGKETVLHSFAGYPADGANPYLAGLLMDPQGNLYGVTEYGGRSAEGVAYELSKTGRWTVLRSFTAGRDGYYPAGTLVMDRHENLYGTTQRCGRYCYGTVWKMSKDGTETVLHTFEAGSSDGDNPRAGVIMDAKGNFYGDTEFGGNSYHGVVYELDTKGVLTVLHNFVGWDGLYPIGGVIRDAKGNLYGTTSYGGSGEECQSGCGTVWQITSSGAMAH